MSAYVATASATAAPGPDDLCLGVLGRGVLLAPHGAGVRVPSLADLPDAEDLTPMGALDGRGVWGARVAACPAHLRTYTWPALGALADAGIVHAGARALQVMMWRARHRWCGACAGPLEDLRGAAGRRCPACRLDVFVASEPAALVAVVRDGPAGPEVLLARHTYRHSEMWMLVGGYADPAETLEQAAAREVAEEVGLAVTDLAYHGSEAWGLDGPGILITVFTARPVDPAAEPAPDRAELSEAAFFPLSALPTPLPPAHHITHRVLADLRDLTVHRGHVGESAHPPDR